MPTAEGETFFFFLAVSCKSNKHLEKNRQIFFKGGIKDLQYQADRPSDEGTTGFLLIDSLL